MKKAQTKGKSAKSDAKKKPAPEAEAKGPAEGPAEEALISKDQVLRLQADFENFRKRTVRERAEWYRKANEDLMTELLPVLDHFELGLRSAEEHDADRDVVDGFRLVYDQMLSSLKKFGLEPIDAEGQPFDPHLHEAMTHLPSDEHPEDTVITQTRRGYKLGDMLLRAAQVVVSGGPGPEADDSSAEGEG